jgi:hypothetical protein
VLDRAAAAAGQPSQTGSGVLQQLREARGLYETDGAAAAQLLGRLLADLDDAQVMQEWMYLWVVVVVVAACVCVWGGHIRCLVGGMALCVVGGLGREGLVLQQLREAQGLYDTDRAAAARLSGRVLADLDDAQVGSKAGGHKGFFLGGGVVLPVLLQAFLQVCLPSSSSVESTAQQ